MTRARLGWSLTALILLGLVFVPLLVHVEAAPTLKEFSSRDYPIQVTQSVTDTLLCSVDPDTTHYWEAIPITLGSVRRWKLDVYTPDTITAEQRGVAVKMSKADATADTLDNIWVLTGSANTVSTTSGWHHVQVDTFWLRGMGDDDDIFFYSLTVEGWE